MAGWRCGLGHGREEAARCSSGCGRYGTEDEPAALWDDPSAALSSATATATARG